MVYHLKLGYDFMRAGEALEKVDFRVRHFGGVFSCPVVDRISGTWQHLVLVCLCAIQLVLH